MVVAQRWTGREAAALRQASRMSIRAYAANEARFGPTGGHRKLATAYGYDITMDPSWPLLQEARELKMIAAAVPLLASAPGVAEEFQLRLRSVHSGDTNVRWTAFGDLPR